MHTRKIVSSHTSTVTDMRTGEAVETVENRVTRLPVEPPYVKMYINDLCDLKGVPAALKATLIELLRKLDYEGFITLSPRSRQAICERLGIRDQSFRNQLTKLCKSKILVREGTNEYAANPKYFGRGEWKNIIEQRRAFELKIQYSEAGRSITGGALDGDAHLQTDWVSSDD